MILIIFFSFQVQFQDGKVCLAIKELYKTLKDHKNPFMQELVTVLYQYSFREEYQSLKRHVSSILSRARGLWKRKRRTGYTRHP